MKSFMRAALAASLLMATSALGAELGESHQVPAVAAACANPLGRKPAALEVIKKSLTQKAESDAKKAN